jgi:uncharacterized membrane protein YeaQ/YmgE (transglycosylase-associated protein family)
MNLIIVILLGALVGYIANRIAKRDSGFIFSAITGIVGAILGNLVSVLVTGNQEAFLAFDLSGLLWALGGALIFVFVLNAIQRRRV